MKNTYFIVYFLSIFISSYGYQKSCKQIWTMNNDINGITLYKLSLDLCVETGVVNNVPDITKFLPPAEKITNKTNIEDIINHLNNTNSTLNISNNISEVVNSTNTSNIFNISNATMKLYNGTFITNTSNNTSNNTIHNTSNNTIHNISHNTTHNTSIIAKPINHTFVNATVNNIINKTNIVNKTIVINETIKSNKTIIANKTINAPIKPNIPKVEINNSYINKTSTNSSILTNVHGEELFKPTTNNEPVEKESGSEMGVIVAISCAIGVVGMLIIGAYCLIIKKRETYKVNQTTIPVQGETNNLNVNKPNAKQRIRETPMQNKQRIRQLVQADIEKARVEYNKKNHVIDIAQHAMAIPTHQTKKLRVAKTFSPKNINLSPPNSSKHAPPTIAAPRLSFINKQSDETINNTLNSIEQRVKKQLQAANAFQNKQQPNNNQLTTK